MIRFLSTYTACTPTDLSCVAEQGKRKRSRPSTVTSTPVKDGSSDSSAPAKNSEESNTTQEETSQPAVAETCEPKCAEDQSTAENSTGTGTAEAPQPAVKEKPPKTSKERSDRKREKEGRKERKSESASPVVQPPDRASPICNGTATDDMNVCK